MDEQHGTAGDDADDLLRRALIDPEASVAVAMKVGGLALTEARNIVSLTCMIIDRSAEISHHQVE